MTSKNTAAGAPRPVVSCPAADHMGVHACKNKAQCWEPCGELGHSAEHAVVSRQPNQTPQCCNPVEGAA